MLKKNGTKIAVFGRIGENSNVWKDRSKKSKVYKKKRPELLCLEKEIKIIMFQRTRLKFQGIQG